jgi:hypothetical protein
MRNLQFTFFLFCGIIFLKTESAFAQNLQFNQAIFNTYGPGNADGNQSTPMFTGSLVVGSNQVLKITSGNCSSLNYVQTGGSTPGLIMGILVIDDFHYQLGALNQMELWLPTGTYTIKGYEHSSVIIGGSFKGMISGVLYDIVP